jgi:hypothetical protein
VELLQIPLAFFGGFVVAVYSFRPIVSWLFYSWAQWKPVQGERSIVAFLVALFMSPGPWVLIALVLVSSYFASSWWAPWAFAGVSVGAVYLVGVTVFVIRKSKRESNERAA